MSLISIKKTYPNLLNPKLNFKLFKEVCFCSVMGGI